MGTAWSKSGQIEFANNGTQADGAKAYFYSGGTTTPLSVYEDADETTPHDFPLEADANGRWPLVFIPYTTSYDVKVTTEAGTQLYYYTEIPNPDPVTAASDTVDDAELIQTGDIIFSPKTGTRTGFVRCNGRTIGSAASGATERANADTATLYSFLWDNFANSILAVSTGRGASAAADFAANKTIALFDLRSGGLLGVDDMGNSAASLGSAATYTTGNSTTGGSIGGKNDHTLTSTQQASMSVSVSGTPAGTVTITQQPTFTFPLSTGAAGANTTSALAPNTGTVAANAATTQTQNVTATFTGSGLTSTGTASGGGGAHNNVQKSLLGNWLMKL